MNLKRLVIAIFVVFVAKFFTDFFIHGVWLQPGYKETMNLWRSETEMQSHFSSLLLGQFLAVVTFVVLWARGSTPTTCIKQALAFGLFTGLFIESTTLVMYATEPLPANIATKWFIAGIAQWLLLSLVVFFVYKHKAAAISKV